MNISRNYVRKQSRRREIESRNIKSRRRSSGDSSSDRHCYVRRSSSDSESSRKQRRRNSCDSESKRKRSICESSGNNGVKMFLVHTWVRMCLLYCQQMSHAGVISRRLPVME